MTALSPLHSFFAESLPLARLQANVSHDIKIVHDNARGLTKTSAVSERRRQYEARRGYPFNSPLYNRKRMNRWESELPDLLAYSNSPPAPQRCESVQVAALAESAIAPQIPRRRTSLEEAEDHGSCAYEPEDTLHSRGSQSSSSSRSSRSNGSTDYALAPPRRRTSCLAWLDEVEANDLLHDATTNQTQETKLTWTKSPADLLVRVDARHGGGSSRKSKSSPKSRTKTAPRRPRRMKSMDPEDSVEVPQPHHDSISETSDESLRSSLSDSIHSVTEQLIYKLP